MKPKNKARFISFIGKAILFSINVLFIMLLASNLSSCIDDESELTGHEVPDTNQNPMIDPADTLNNWGNDSTDTVSPGGYSKTAFYVSTNGSDSNPGTFDKPWASWQKAFTELSAGDTVYIRGGTYYAGTEDEYGAYAYRKRGTALEPICIFNYPGETPILDCSTIKSLNENIGIYFLQCAYIHVKGLTVTGVSQHSKNMGAEGFDFEDGGSFVVEQCIAYGNQGAGFQGFNVDEIYLLNCDSYDNFDVSTTGYIGGQADGFVFCYASHDAYTYFKGCRAWFNSDDGFDTWNNEGIVVFEECWAFNNGRGDGDGNGYKLGETSAAPLSEPQRILKNCMAFNNRFMGFNQNDGNVRMVLYNNISYDNDLNGYEFIQYTNPMVARNNIDYKNGRAPSFSKYVTHDHNSWDASPRITLTDGDFISLDQSLALGSRQSDGSLPETDFLRPVQGSDLINAGVDVGIPFSGKAPDLGPFEQE